MWSVHSREVVQPVRQSFILKRPRGSSGRTSPLLSVLLLNQTADYKLSVPLVLEVSPKTALSADTGSSKPRGSS